MSGTAKFDNARQVKARNLYINHVSKEKIGEIIPKDDKTFKLYKIHDKLTDKKLLRTITKEEEKELEKIRNEIESHDNSNLASFWKNRVTIYQKILDDIEEIKKLL